MTTIVNKKSGAAYDVYIGRPSTFGNPYPLGKYSREESIRKYKKYFWSRVRTDPEFLEAVLSLRGKRLGCFCKPLPCHGDIISDFLAWYTPEKFEKYITSP